MINPFTDWLLRHKQEDEEVRSLRERFAKESPLFVQEIRPCERAYLVVLAEHFETASEAKAAAVRMTERLDATKGSFTVMATTYDIAPLKDE